MSADQVRKVLFISADQWRGECLSALDHACVRTPNLDALAAEGVLFRNHYCQASPCGPARTSMLTGMYMMNHRSLRNGTPQRDTIQILAGIAESDEEEAEVRKTARAVHAALKKKAVAK